MAFYSLVEQVMLRLSGLPGLGFLRRYVLEFQSRQASVRQRVADYKRHAGAVRAAGAEVAQAAGGSSQDADADDDEEEDSGEDDADDFESFMQ